jgi:hypothetical protein
MLTGLVAYAVNAMAMLAQLAAGRGTELRRQMAEQMQKSISESSDPQATAAMQRLVDWMQTPQGFAMMMTLTLLMLGVGFVLFTGLGGAIGGSMLRRDRK